MESTNVRESVRLGACGNSLAPELWPSWGARKCRNLYFLSQDWPCHQPCTVATRTSKGWSGGVTKSQGPLADCRFKHFLEGEGTAQFEGAEAARAAGCFFTLLPPFRSEPVSNVSAGCSGRASSGSETARRLCLSAVGRR